MKMIDFALIITYIYMIIFFLIGSNMLEKCKEDFIISTYNKKIEYALSSSLERKFDLLSEEIQNNFAINNNDINFLNYDEMYKEFIKILNLNCNNEFLEVNKQKLILSEYLDKYVVVENDGMYINSIDTNGERRFLEKVPYTLNYNDNTYIFELNDEYNFINKENGKLLDAELSNKSLLNIKNMAITSTIRRNLVLENNHSIVINIPFKENNFKTITNRTVIATFKDCPVFHNRNINFVAMSGNEVRDSYLFVINDNDRYIKKSINSIDLEKDIYFFSKKEAGKKYYPEI